MADQTGIENTAVTPNLLNALLQRGNAFSFLQAYRTLTKVVAEQGGNPEQDIRIRPALSLELPKASIADIKHIASEDAADKYEIQTSFLGLYGASSPLPNFYTEDLIAAEQEDEIQARLLLDVFHQRMYRLYAEALQKYQPVYELSEQQDSHFLRLLWSLIGIRDPHIRQAMPQPGLFLQYINLYGRQQKSAAGLQFVVSDYLCDILPPSTTGVPVDVEQCVEQHLDIPVRDMLGLGMGKALGVNAVIGRYVTDYSGKLLVSIGPIALEDYHALTSDAQHWQGLVSLIRAYIGPALTCELEFSVTAETMDGVCLGDPDWSNIGLSTWLHTPVASGITKTEASVGPLLRLSRVRLN